MKKQILRLFTLRNRHLFFADTLLLIASPALAFFLRMESFHAFSEYASPLILFTLINLAYKQGVFVSVGLYSQYWRSASVEELLVLLKATGLTFITEVALFFGILVPAGIIVTGFPRSVPVVDGILVMVMIGGSRLIIRVLFAYCDQQRGGENLKSAIVVGAGVAGTMIVREIRANKRHKLDLVGFIDDDPEKRGQRIHGIPVLGTRADLPGILKRRKVAQVIIAMPTAPGKVVRDVVQACKAAGVASKTLPSLSEILKGTARVDQLRNVQLEDLLRRGAVNTDTARVAELLHNTRVMVTGAGGSIGSELCRQIKEFGPSELILLGHGENSVFHIARELLEQPRQGMAIRSVIADIRDRERMAQIFETYQPQVVFHAAAHKHVGLMESNAPDAVTNNILGTRVLTELSERWGVDRFVMISSDKAVNPSSIMGVTKRIAERIVGETARRTARPFVSVRFGNVLGSRGSVVPVINRQIELGGPITITHPDVRRFFMTIPEAVQLVLQAGTMGSGGEVFVLDMGEQIRVIDLARDLIRLSGLEEGQDIDIVFTGLLPGEKMFEELHLNEERVERTEHEKILACFGNRSNGASDGHKSPADEYSEKLRIDVETLIEAAYQGSLHLIERLFKRIVPEYQSSHEDSQLDLPLKVSPLRERSHVGDRAAFVAQGLSKREDLPKQAEG